MRKRNKFSLSNYKLATFNQGELVPIGLQEVLPGDTFQQSTSALIRVSPLNAPVMHPVQVRIHHFYVPTRIMWDEFEDFITGGSDGLDETIAPTLSSGGTGFAIGSVADYFGLPTGVPNINVSALPFRAYNLIRNEYYRDQDLETESVVSTESGPDTTTETILHNVSWEKDYFTTARPWEQKGTAVTLPIGGEANVVSKGSPHFPQLTDPVNGPSDSNITGYGTDYRASKNFPTEGNLVWGSETGLKADLSTASAMNINDLREAFGLQRYAENRARYGSRYTEYLRYCGVTSSDARLQRPEYLGGGKQTIQFSEVLATAEGTNTAVGDMKGHGIAAMRTNRYRRFFEEHGYVITLMSVKPKTIYSQGISKMWTRATKEDYFQKELQHIGQEEIKNKEIYAAHSDPEAVFGYADRYDEYRRCESTISGEFRVGGGLEHWHMARHFTGDVALNESFIKSNPTNRIYASTATDQLYVMANHSIQARRMMSKTGIPMGL